MSIAINNSDVTETAQITETVSKIHDQSIVDENLEVEYDSDEEKYETEQKVTNFGMNKYVVDENLEMEYDSENEQEQGDNFVMEADPVKFRHVCDENLDEEYESDEEMWDDYEMSVNVSKTSKNVTICEELNVVHIVERYVKQKEYSDDEDSEEDEDFGGEEDDEDEEEMEEDD